MLSVYALLLGETGMRSESEAPWIKWDHVSLDEGFIWVHSDRKHRTKSGRRPLGAVDGAAGPSPGRPYHSVPRGVVSRAADGLVAPPPRGPTYSESREPDRGVSEPRSRRPAGARISPAGSYATISVTDG